MFKGVIEQVPSSSIDLIDGAISNFSNEYYFTCLSFRYGGVFEYSPGHTCYLGVIYTFYNIRLSLGLTFNVHFTTLILSI